MYGRIKKAWVSQKKILLLCIAFTFVFGFVAHGYIFANFHPNHDSFDGLYAAGRENNHKIELGRVLVPAYRTLFSGLLAMPWLKGILALFWIAVGVWMIAAMFRFHSKFNIALLCGIMAVNSTVTALAGTYFHDLDQNMFSMMMASLAALLWDRRPFGWFVFGAIAVSISLGIYQSYISVTIGLVMIALLMQLLHGEKPLVILRRGMEAVAMLVVSGILFLLLVKIITATKDIALANRNNSLSAMKNLRLQEVPELLKGVYRSWWGYFEYMPNTWLVPQAAKWINRVLMLFAAVILVPCTMIRRDLSWIQKLFVLMLTVLLPLGWNICYLITSGFIHQLMQYAYILFYVLCLCLATFVCEKKEKLPAIALTRWVCSGLIVLLLWGGIQTANTYHLKKTLASMATNSRMTGVYHDMLSLDYIPGETPVMIWYDIPLDNPPGFGQSDCILGSINNTITGDQKSIKSYFNFMLGDNANFCTNDRWNELNGDEFVQTIPSYPEYGYISYLEDVMVVRLK